MYRWLLLIALMINCSVSYAETKVAITDWPPYYSKKLLNGGPQLELLHRVFDKMNLTMVPVWYRTGTGALVNTRTGRMAAAAGWECNQERAKHFYFSDPIGVEQTVFFHRKSFRFNDSTLSNLNQQITVGITSRYSYGEALEDLLDKPNVKVEIGGSDRHNLDLLYHGGIDLFVLDKQVGLALLKDTHDEMIKKITYHKTPLRGGNVALRLLFSKNIPNAKQMTSDFNRALAEIRRQQNLTELEPNKFSSCPR